MKILPTFTLKSALAGTALIFLPAVAQAVEFSISGQVNRLIMNIDNGVESGVVHADNSIAGTRWRIEGMDDLDNGMTAGLLLENQLESNPSSEITAESIDTDGDEEGTIGQGDYFTIRQANVWLKGNFGKVTIGQGSGAADGTTELDLSGTNVIQYSGASNDLLGSMEYGSSDVIVDQVRSNFDGLGRNDNIRYDAALGPVGVAVSTGNGSKVELGMRYGLENLKVEFGLWDENDSGLGYKGFGTSASWLGDSGFNVSASMGGDDRDGDPRNVYLKLGYKHGNHAFGIDASETRDLEPADATSYSIAWVGLMLQGVELYATYRVESLDNVAGAEDITALAGGARIKF
jgi:predicted porin